jgi:hypothetical protein
VRNGWLLALTLIALGVGTAIDGEVPINCHVTRNAQKAIPFIRLVRSDRRIFGADAQRHEREKLILVEQPFD